MVFLTAARQARKLRKAPDRWWRKKVIFDQAKHFYGRNSNCYSLAIRAVHRAWVFQNRNRHVKKWNLRRLWILRIHAGAKEHELRYAQFVGGIIKHNIALDRKVLAQLAIYEPKTFQSLAELSKQKFEEGLLAGLAEDPDKIVNRLTTQEDLLEEGLRKLRLNAAQGTSPS